MNRRAPGTFKMLVPAVCINAGYIVHNFCETFEGFCGSFFTSFELWSARGQTTIFGVIPKSPLPTRADQLSRERASSFSGLACDIAGASTDSITRPYRCSPRNSKVLRRVFCSGGGNRSNPRGLAILRAGDLLRTVSRDSPSVFGSQAREGVGKRRMAPYVGRQLVPLWNNCLREEPPPQEVQFLPSHYITHSHTAPVGLAKPGARRRGANATLCSAAGTSNR